MILQDIKSYFYRRFRTSFSKSGEDIQLWQLLKKEKGVFVDIGAHHPIFGNNTYFFYLRGWKGMNVEPNPEFEPLYKKFRNNDIFYRGGIAQFDGELEYYELESNVKNTFSKRHIKDFQLQKEVSTSKYLPVIRLSVLFETYLTAPYTIDFISIDVEGMEMEVVNSNDWIKFRPKYILLETHSSIKEDLESELTQYLFSKHYQLIGKTLQGYHLGTLWYRANEVGIS